MPRVLIFTILAFPILTPAQPLQLGIYLKFDNQPAEDSVKAMEDEVSDILKPAGYAVNWRFVDENKGAEAFADLLVVRFTGRCRLEPIARNEFSLPGETVTLASTEVSAGHVLPFSEVQCDQVRRIMANAGGRDRHLLLGRALGRVVAHELYHLLAHTTGHAASGLAKATQTWKDLGRASCLAPGVWTAAPFSR